MTYQAQEFFRRLMDGRMINREKALKEFGCKNLTACVSELRKLGVRFHQYNYWYDQFSKSMVRDAQYFMKPSDRKYNNHFISI